MNYERALALTNKENSVFYKQEVNIDGFKIVIFNYRLAQYNDFVNTEEDNREMRGLTFVFNEDGTLFKRYLALHKFFNLNQVPESQYELIKDFKIKHVNNKEDGSISNFIKLPNNRVLAKSKMSFISDQAIGMNRVYEKNKEIRDFINWTFDMDYQATFEYVAPDNRIVLNYDKEDLILLKLRNNKGEYLDISDINIRKSNFEEYKLDDLIELSKTITNKEGWVIQFENGLFIKIKTDWYRDLHHLTTECIYRENLLIKLIIEEKIDDILGNIDDSLKDRVLAIVDIVKKTIKEKVEDINKLYNESLKYTVKDFAIKYKGDKDFYLFNKLKHYDVNEVATEWLKYKTRNLLLARDFLKDFNI